MTKDDTQGKTLKTITKITLETIRLRLASLPPKPKSDFTKNESVAELEADIEAVMDLGHSLNDITKIFEEEGLDITPEALAVVLRKLRAKRLNEINVEKAKSKAVTGKRTRTKDAKVPAPDICTRLGIADAAPATSTVTERSESYRDIDLMLADIAEETARLAGGADGEGR